MTPPAAAAARSPAFVTAPFVPLRTGYIQNETTSKSTTIYSSFGYDVADKTGW